jgi:hypothetical protein
MKRANETANVKRELIAKGFEANNVRVKHGTGTAWSWITVSADIHRTASCSCGAPDMYGRRETCEECKKLWRSVYNRIIELTLNITGRKGDYNGRINVNLGFFS